MSRLIDADALKERIRKALGIKSFDNLLPSEKTIVKQIDMASTIQPVIVPCDYAKACNEATMNKLTSAVAYYDVLEELRKHGYVLVDMREVNNESN